MKRTIKKVAVLGSGIMGSRIACHFANTGVRVLLLDIVPDSLSEQEKQAGVEKDSAQHRNRIARDALQAAVGSKPAPLYHKKFLSRIETGNFEDDMSRIGECDWVLEAVVENLDIKKALLRQVEQYRKPGTLVTSNTSGIPIHMMAADLSADMRRHFCGTHFFNPPRYLELLEVIPGPDTDGALIDFLMKYGNMHLGKTTVLCKDTPAFIANRVGIFAILQVLKAMQKLDLGIDAVDKLTGPLIGRPKSATFRTSDVVGLDTLARVAENLHEGLPDDEARDIFVLPAFVRDLVEKRWLGEKTGQGFYKKTRDAEGKTQILTLDMADMEYKPRKKVHFATLDATKPIDDLRNRLPVLLAGKDKAGAFYRESFYGLFQYITYRIPEITDALFKIDDAICAGFGWEIGPFETWDLLDPGKTVVLMEEMGYKPAGWVYDMLASGVSTFYKLERGRKLYYDIPAKAYKAVPGRDAFIILNDIREDKEIWNNAGASIFDLGDGILNLEFHTKMNTLGGEVIEGFHKALDMAEELYRGLVIGNQGPNFSAGANLGMVFMYAIEQEYDELNMLIKTFQDSIMRARYSSVPVVVAPHGMALGGGCELTLHADAVQAAAETYIGLVEVGVGLIPGGGGTKEMTLRVSDRVESGDVEYNKLQNTFMDIATGRVATSAEEARDMHILRSGDRVSISKKRLIADARRTALDLAELGYQKPVPREDIRVQGKGGMALFLSGIYGMRRGDYISDHDVKIAEKIAYVMNGGDLSAPSMVSEQYLLDLEREAFLSLCGERKTLERIESILNKGKTLRN
jgi:3-hydroxyacyl-CoA dehydrogenase